MTIEISNYLVFNKISTNEKKKHKITISLYAAIQLSIKMEFDCSFKSQKY